MTKKILVISLLFTSIFGIKAFASSDYNNNVAKMKQICANYSKYRLSLDKSTYMSTRSSDYDRLEQKTL